MADFSHFSTLESCESDFQFLVRECEKCEKVDQDVEMSSNPQMCAFSMRIDFQSDVFYATSFFKAQIIESN